MMFAGLVKLDSLFSVEQQYNVPESEQVDIQQH